MKGIRPKGMCPICKKPFHFNERRMMFLCEKHQTVPTRYLVDFFYDGKRIRRGTTLDGKTLRTFVDAQGLLDQMRGEKDNKRFDPERWKSKARLDFKFSTLIWKWYEEKERLLDQGKLAPGYVPKLKSYIKHYERYFGNKDVREIFNTKEFSRQLPPSLSLKYQKNLIMTLNSFFIWLKQERYTADLPVFEKIEVPEHDPVVITRETQERLLEFIPVGHRPLFAFFFYQGCRPGEARALMWDCIDGDTVTIKRTFSASRLVERTKTKTIRYNYLYPETRAILPERTTITGFVFTHGKEIKRHYSAPYFNRIFRHALDEFNRHYGTDLKIEAYEAGKHSWGTQKVNDGVSMDLIQGWFGHTKRETTEKYAKLRVVDAFRRLNNVVPLDARKERG
jgi:integrase